MCNCGITKKDLRFRYFDALKKDEGDRYKLISRYLQTKKKSLVKNWSRKPEKSCLSMKIGTFERK